MKTILVVDDDPTISKLIRLVVEANGYSVLTATSEVEALNCFEEYEGQVDLLITDVVLKSGSGIDVALELRSLVPYLKIVLMSGYPIDAAELFGSPVGSVGILEKPFPPMELLGQICRLIGKPVTTETALAIAYKAVA